MFLLINNLPFLWSRKNFICNSFFSKLYFNSYLIFTFVGKSLPVHCIVEQIPGPQACGQHVELDSYAIVPCDTLFNDLVRTALGKLGYSTAQILGAKGKVCFKLFSETSHKTGMYCVLQNNIVQWLVSKEVSGDVQDKSERLI